MRINGKKSSGRARSVKGGALSSKNPKLLIIISIVGLVLIAGIVVLCLFLTGAIGNKGDLVNELPEYYSVSGEVTYNGIPISGVTVKGTNANMMTDSEGKFSIAKAKKGTTIIFASPYYSFTPASLLVDGELADKKMTASLKKTVKQNITLSFLGEDDKPFSSDFRFYIDNKENTYTYSAVTGYTTVQAIAGQLLFIDEENTDSVKLLGGTKTTIEEDPYQSIKVINLKNAVSVSFMNGENKVTADDFAIELSGGEYQVEKGKVDVFAKKGDKLKVLSELIALYDASTGEVIDEYVFGEIPAAEENEKPKIAINICYLQAYVRTIYIKDTEGNSVIESGIKLNGTTVNNGYAELSLKVGDRVSLASSTVKLHAEEGGIASDTVIDGRHIKYTIIVDYIAKNVELHFVDCLGSSINNVKAYSNGEFVGECNENGVLSIATVSASKDLTFVHSHNNTARVAYEFDALTVKRTDTSITLTGKCVYDAIDVSFTVLYQDSEPYDTLKAYAVKGNQITEIASLSERDEVEIPVEDGTKKVRIKVSVSSIDLSKGYDYISIYATKTLPDLSTKSYYYKAVGFTIVSALIPFDMATEGVRYCGKINGYSGSGNETQLLSNQTFKSKNGYAYGTDSDGKFDITLSADDTLFSGDFFPIDAAKEDFAVVDCSEKQNQLDETYLVLNANSQMLNTYVYSADVSTVMSFENEMTLRFVFSDGFETEYKATRQEDLGFVFNVIIPYTNNTLIRNNIKLYVDDIQYDFDVYGKTLTVVG